MLDKIAYLIRDEAGKREAVRGDLEPTFLMRER